MTQPHDPRPENPRPDEAPVVRLLPRQADPATNGEARSSGTYAFLFTDIEGSTQLWEQHPEAMGPAVALHDETVLAAIADNGGTVFAPGGDGFAAAFNTVDEALAAALRAQADLAAQRWPESTAIRVRMAIHVGAAELRDDNYFGPALNHGSRLMSAGHGGQILCSQAAVDLLGHLTPDTALVDLGQHRLRDLTRPEHVYQVTHTGCASDFPPLRTLESLPTNLPLQPTDFIGRERELRAIRDALTASHLTTLTGVGGVGKTRLAVQAAADLLPQYQDGVWLVELGSLVDADAIDLTFCTALGLQPPPGQPPRQHLLDTLRQRELLLVVDNCEHLLAPVCNLLSTLLRSCSGLRVLATSREPLGVEGERILGVPSLSLPEASGIGEELLRSEAVQLFLDRARAARAAFELTDANAAAVAQLCRRLDGIPLGLELAAARVRSLSPAEILARLDQRFRLLSGGSRTAASRHQTLQRTIDWSYELLEREEQLMFQRIGVFAGSFSLEAAEDICADEALDRMDVVDLLGRLVDKSLLVMEGDEAETRYRMLETIRQYAEDRLFGSGEAPRIARKHAEHYGHFARMAGEGLRGRAEVDWMHRVERELDNARAAITWALAQDEAALAIDIVIPLAIPTVRTEPVTCAWAETIAASPSARLDRRFPAIESLACYGAVFERVDLVAAERIAAICRETTDVDVDVRTHVLALSAGVMIALTPTEFEGFAEEWVRLAEASNDDWMLVRALTAFATTASMAGKDVLGAAERAVALARAVGNPSSLAIALLALGMAYNVQQPARALAAYHDAIEAGKRAYNELMVSAASSTAAATLALTASREGVARQFVENAAEDLRIGNRMTFISELSYFSRLMTQDAHYEVAAIVLGHVHGVVGGDRPLYLVPLRAPVGDLDMSETLTANLGHERFSELVAKGALLSDEETIAAARECVDANYPITE